MYENHVGKQKKQQQKIGEAMKKLIVMFMALATTLAVLADDCLNFDTAKNGRDCSASFEQSNYYWFEVLETRMSVTFATAYQNKVNVRFVGFSATGNPTILDQKAYYGCGIDQDIEVEYKVDTCDSKSGWFPWHWEVINYKSIALIIEVFEPAQYQNGKVMRWNMIGNARVDGRRGP